MNKKKLILLIIVLLIILGKIGFSYKSKYFSIELNNSKEASKELDFFGWINKGNEAAKNGDDSTSKEAFENAKKVAKTDEDQSLATYCLSRFLPKNEQIKILEDEMNKKFFIPDIPLQLMLLYHENGYNVEAINDIANRAIAQIKNWPKFSSSDKKLYLYKINFDAAIYADDNNDEESFKNYTNRAMDNFDESFKKIDTQWHNLFHYKARVEFRNGNFSEAEKFLAEIPLELLNEEQKSIVIKDKAYSKMGQGKFEEAKELLNESAKLGNSGAVSYLDKFDSYKKKIEKHIKDGVKFNPINP